MSRSSRSKAKSRDRRKRAAPSRPAADGATRRITVPPWNRAHLSPRGLRRILRLVGVTPEEVEQWSAKGMFPIPGTTAGTVERWLSGSEAIPETAGGFLLEIERRFLLEAEESLRWHVFDMHRTAGGYDPEYKVSAVIFDDESLFAKYDGETQKKAPHSVNLAFNRFLARRLALEGIEMVRVRFVESEYLAYLAERGEGHSGKLLQEWGAAKGERTYLAEREAKARARDVAREEDSGDGSAPPADMPD